MHENLRLPMATLNISAQCLAFVAIHGTHGNGRNQGGHIHGQIHQHTSLMPMFDIFADPDILWILEDEEQTHHQTHIKDDAHLKRAPRTRIHKLMHQR